MSDEITTIISHGLVDTKNLVVEKGKSLTKRLQRLQELRNILEWFITKLAQAKGLMAH